MKAVGDSKIWSFVGNSSDPKPSSNTRIRKDRGLFISSYEELAVRIAELQFRNPDFVLLFRGQGGDYKNQQRNSTIKPSLFRPKSGSTGPPDGNVLRQRFDALAEAEQQLTKLFRNRNLLGKLRIARYKILRWSILQHYEICFTPLLDVTHSLRIAASFASMTDRSEAFLYAIAVPQISGSVTANAEAGLQVIRLSSVCPPVAKRPHFQEGYLLGEYPDMVDFDQKVNYQAHEIDFGLRLVAKFRLDPTSFWNEQTFPVVPKEALYPDPTDKLYRLLDSMKQDYADQT